MKKIVLFSLVGLLILVLYGCGPIPFVTPGVEEPPEVPEGLEIELDPAASLELAQPKGSTRYIPSDTVIGTWDLVNRIYTLTTDVNEGIVIDEDNLTLDGAGHTITGSGWGYGVYLDQRSNVTVKNCVVSGFWSGIYLYSSNDNTLTNNKANNNSYGIYLTNYSDSNTLTNNTANNDYRGICLYYHSDSNTLTNNTANNNDYRGIYLYYSSSNTLTNNTANNNKYHGIYLHAGSSNTLTDNTVNYNEHGIGLAYECSSNNLTGNTAKDNIWGILIAWSSNNNEVYNNNFIDNTKQAYVAGSIGNVFSLDKPVGGNYWSDWTSPDVDYDGFVDSPYVFTGGQDNLPWVCQDGWKPAGATGYLITIVEDFELPTGIEKSLTVLLEKAINALENYHEQAAIGQLTGFIYHVEGLQNSNILTEEQADALIAAAQGIIDSIQ